MSSTPAEVKCNGYAALRFYGRVVDIGDGVFIDPELVPVLGLAIAPGVALGLGEPQLPFGVIVPGISEVLLV